MSIAGSLAHSVRVLRPDGCHVDAVANRETCSNQHTSSDANLRAYVAANNRAIASPYDCSSGHCIAPYLNTCSR